MIKTGYEIIEKDNDTKDLIAKLVDERASLIDKINKIYNIIMETKAQQYYITDIQKSLLHVQKNVMETYIEILRLRIEDLAKNVKYEGNKND